MWPSESGWQRCHLIGSHFYSIRDDLYKPRIRVWNERNLQLLPLFWKTEAFNFLIKLSLIFCKYSTGKVVIM